MQKFTDEKIKDIHDGFHPWVKAQDPTASYVYFENGNCAFARYLKSLGYTDVCVGAFDWSVSADGANAHSLPHQLFHQLAIAAGGLKATTFGELDVVMSEEVEEYDA